MQFGYVAGVVEGLAYARYVSDGKTTDGMGCIYDWYYKTDGTFEVVLDAFGRFPDHTAGAVMAALVNKECGS